MNDENINENLHEENENLQEENIIALNQNEENINQNYKFENLLTIFIIIILALSFIIGLIFLIIYIVGGFSHKMNDIYKYNSEENYDNDNKSKIEAGYITAIFNITNSSEKVAILGFLYYKQKYVNEIEVNMRYNLTEFSYKINFPKNGVYILKYFYKSVQTDLIYMFEGCKYLVYADLTKFNISSIKRLSYMFRKCTSLLLVDLSNLYADEMTELVYVFHDCTSLKQVNMHNFNAPQVISFQGMFSGCESIEYLNLTSIVPKKLKYLTSMFSECISLKTVDLSSIYGDYIKSMNYMFYKTYNISYIDLRNFNYTLGEEKDNIFFNNTGSNETVIILKNKKMINFIPEYWEKVIITNSSNY